MAKTGKQLIEDRTRKELGGDYNDAVGAGANDPSYGTVVTNKRQKRQESIDKNRKKRMAEKKLAAASKKANQGKPGLAQRLTENAAKFGETTMNNNPFKK